MNQTNLGVNWSLETLAGGTGSFVTGPATPPSGSGSFSMTTLATNVDKATLLTSDWTGRLLSDLSAIDYWTYRSSDSTSPSYVAPSINIAIFTNVSGPGTGFATLVFEPLYSYGNDAILDDVWQQWDGLEPSHTGFAGGWWATQPVGSICRVDCYRTLGDFQAAAPGATIIRLGVNVGRGPASFIGSVDALSLTMAGQTTTYDFELLGESKESCKNDGWKDFHDHAYKNQGDCVSFFASANRHGPKVHDLAGTSTVTKHGNGHAKTNATTAKTVTAKVHATKHAASTKKVAKQAIAKGNDKPKNK